MTSTVRVLMLGGSVFAREAPDVDYLGRFARLVQERVACGERILIVAGGGRPAREWIQAARAAGQEDEAVLDAIGIQATRLNAQLLQATLHVHLGPQTATSIPADVATTAGLLEHHRVAVMGGTVPGHSTDFVAASLATAADADHLYVLTNVEGVYSADPATDDSAHLLPELPTSRLVALAGSDGWSAGRSGIVDPSCARHVHEHRLALTVMNGRDLDGLTADLQGRRNVGSVVHPDRPE